MLRPPAGRAAAAAVLAGVSGHVQVVDAPRQPLPARQIHRQIRAPEEADRECQARDRVLGSDTSKGTDNHIQVGQSGFDQQNELIIVRYIKRNTVLGVFLTMLCHNFQSKLWPWGTERQQKRDQSRH